MVVCKYRWLRFMILPYKSPQAISNLLLQITKTKNVPCPYFVFIINISGKIKALVMNKKWGIKVILFYETN